MTQGGRWRSGARVEDVPPSASDGAGPRPDHGATPPSDGDPQERAPVDPPSGSRPTSQLVTLASLVMPALDRADRRRSGVDVPVPVPFHDWSETLGGGLWPGAHFIVSGTAVGKSQISLQTALGAAKAKIPVAYIGLELDEMQIALRVLGEHANMRWSGLYQGRCSEVDLARARAAAPGLDGLPFYVEFGSARGWPGSRLSQLVQRMRRVHPGGPLLVVLDYLQLVGDEQGEFVRRPDLRERIGNAAYQARDVARRFDASILMISSAARTHYGLLAGDFQAAGLTTRATGFGRRRVITHPHVLIGLGKESGELEFSADTTTVLLRWPTLLDNGETAIIVATPKVRAGPESWSVLAFGGGRFTALPVKDLDELPVPPKRARSRGKESVSDADLEARVLATARRMPTLKSKSTLASNTQGTRTDVLAAIGRLLARGRIEFTSAGVTVREEANP